MKRCIKCGVAKDLGGFHLNKRNKDGRAQWCKVCAAEYSRKYRAENPEKIRESSRKYREANPEKIRESKRKHYEGSAEKYKERSRKCYEDNPEKCKEASRKCAAAQPGGVYELTCVPTGERYIGSAGNLQSRESNHRGNIRRGTHRNPNVRSLSKLYTESDFEFKVILNCDDPAERKRVEQELIDNGPCLNIRNVDGTKRIK